MKKYVLFAMACVCLIAASCQKDKSISEDSNKRGQVKLKFDHNVAGRVLQLGTGLYRNSFNEPYSIENLHYYISNIKLKKNDGSEYIVPKDSSYFLIQAEDTNSLFPKFSVPEGTYTGLTFTLGVDSLANVREDISSRTGALAVENGMYWSWNSGYIFFKMEGKSAAGPKGTYTYHIGGFGGYSSPTINNIKTISLDLTRAGNAIVQQNLSSDIHLMIDLGQVMDGPHKISIAANPTVMFNEFSKQISANYSQMFTHDHTHNYQKLSGE